MNGITKNGGDIDLDRVTVSTGGGDRGQDQEAGRENGSMDGTDTAAVTGAIPRTAVEITIATGERGTVAIVDDEPYCFLTHY